MSQEFLIITAIALSFIAIIFAIIQFFKSKSLHYQNLQNQSLLKELEDQKEKCNSLVESLHKTQILNSGLQKDITYLEEQKSEIFQTLQTMKNENYALNIALNDAITQNAALNATREAQDQKQIELTKAFEEQKNHLKEELTNTMQKILELKIEKFDETSIKSLETLLKPFKENIDGFRKKIEENQKENGERMAGLSKEIEQVMRAGLSIGAEAANLTKALKGEKQTQGRWGEMVLESVLEHSGLIKGEHYATQESYRDEDGKDKRPDIIVKLPQNRSIIIDSKVSLVDYDRFVCAQNDEERLISSVSIAKAFRNHIDTLHSKNYEHYDAGTLQYIFMFVPIEGIYAVAVRQDPSLYEYALKKHIIIVYPSTLVVTLKTIYMYWQREKSDRAVENIFIEAGKLYEKLYSFTENFEKLGKQLESVEASYQKSKIQLFSGSGNLLTRAENLRILGAKTTKNLQTLKLKNSLLEDDNIELATQEEKQEKEKQEEGRQEEDKQEEKQFETEKI